MDVEVATTVAELAHRMRLAGARPGLTHSLTAHRALAAADPAEARLAPRAPLGNRGKDQPMFAGFWAETEAMERAVVLAAVMRAAAPAPPRAAIPGEAPSPPALEDEPLPAAYSDEE